MTSLIPLEKCPCPLPQLASPFCNGTPSSPPIISASAGIQLFHHHTQDLDPPSPGPQARVSSMLGTCSGWIKHTTSTSTSPGCRGISQWSRLSRSYPCGLKPVPGKEEELAQGSGAGGASQLPTEQGLLMAARGLAHESMSARLCTASLPSHRYPAAKKHHVDYSRVGS